VAPGHTAHLGCLILSRTRLALLSAGDRTLSARVRTQDGYIFFDDRGPPATMGLSPQAGPRLWSTDVGRSSKNTMIPCRAGRQEGNLVRRVDMPYYCNHYHANRDTPCSSATMWTDLVLIDISGEEAKLRVLSTTRLHGTPQSSHCPSHLELGRDAHPVTPLTMAGG